MSPHIPSHVTLRNWTWHWLEKYVIANFLEELWSVLMLTCMCTTFSQKSQGMDRVHCSNRQSVVTEQESERGRDFTVFECEENLAWMFYMTWGFCRNHISWKQSGANNTNKWKKHRSAPRIASECTMLGIGVTGAARCMRDSTLSVTVYTTACVYQNRTIARIYSVLMEISHSTQRTDIAFTPVMFRVQNDPSQLFQGVRVPAGRPARTLITPRTHHGHVRKKHFENQDHTATRPLIPTFIITSSIEDNTLLACASTNSKSPVFAQHKYFKKRSQVTRVLCTATGP